MTTTVQEVELYNILSISECKLQNNFTLIVNRLNQNDQQFASHDQRMNDVQTNLLEKIEKTEEKLHSEIYQLQAKIRVMGGQINDLQGELEKTNTNV